MDLGGRDLFFGRDNEILPVVVVRLVLPHPIAYREILQLRPGRVRHHRAVRAGAGELLCFRFSARINRAGARSVAAWFRGGLYLDAMVAHGSGVDQILGKSGGTGVTLARGDGSAGTASRRGPVGDLSISGSIYGCHRHLKRTIKGTARAGRRRIRLIERK